MGRIYLVATFVANKNDERAVIEFDIIVDQVRDARIQLLAHLRDLFFSALNCVTLSDGRWVTPTSR
jgi:hypothetical protein